MKTRVFLFSFLCVSVLGAERQYTLRVAPITKNVTGEPVDHALAINGSIPAPTLRFRLGDEAHIIVHNDMDVPTTLHWHGVLVPWQQDGPQFTNTRIIEPHSSHEFRFPIRHTGTYWYHSHTDLQEQSGLYGAIVIEEETPRHRVDHDVVLVLSDWTNERPEDVLANLKKNGHFYAYKKDFLPSVSDALARGNLGNYLGSEWERMEPMDLADVGYDAFLINGEVESTLTGVVHGQRIRFRIINAGASSYFYFNIGQERAFTVVSKDGMPVRPLLARELLIGMGETYDIIFNVPHETKTWEARATAQDVSGHASLFFGSGHREIVPERERPNPYVMDHGEHGEHEEHGEPGEHGMGEHQEHGGHGGHGHQVHHGDQRRDTGVELVHYRMLESIEPTNFDENLIRAQEIVLELSGDMERYTWYINGRPFSEDKYINIRENEVITFKLVNTTMMHHPIHLHGHFFRVDMGQGDYAPLFHTVDVPPMGTVSMEFHANEPGIWFLHCHNLYHMKMGMSRLVRYEGVEQTIDLKKDEEKWGSSMIRDDDLFGRFEATVLSNVLELNGGINSGRYELDLEGEYDEWDTHEIKGNFRRYFGRFLSLGPGFMLEDDEAHGAIFVGYVLPGLVKTETYVLHNGNLTFEFSKHIPLTGRLELEPEMEFHYDDRWDWSFDFNFFYNFGERFGVGGKMGKEKHGGSSVGAGVRVRF